LFDPNIEHGISLPFSAYKGLEEIKRELIRDAEKRLPSGTKYKLIWDGPNRVAWVYRPQGERARAKPIEELTT